MNVFFVPLLNLQCRVRAGSLGDFLAGKSQSYYTALEVRHSADRNESPHFAPQDSTDVLIEARLYLWRD